MNNFEMESKSSFTYASPAASQDTCAALRPPANSQPSVNAEQGLLCQALCRDGCQQAERNHIGAKINI